MDKIEIEFLYDGLWVDEQSKPAFTVKAGELKMVSGQLANFAVQAQKARYAIKLPEHTETPEPAKKPPEPAKKPLGNRK